MKREREGENKSTARRKTLSVLPRVGSAVEIWWDDRDASFSGKLVRRLGSRRWTFDVAYDDGDKLTHDLDDRTWRYATPGASWYEPGDISEMVRERRDSTFASDSTLKRRKISLGTRRSSRFGRSSDLQPVDASTASVGAHSQDDEDHPSPISEPRSSMPSLILPTQMPASSSAFFSTLTPLSAPLPKSVPFVAPSTPLSAPPSSAALSEPLSMSALTSASLPAQALLPVPPSAPGAISASPSSLTFPSAQSHAALMLSTPTVTSGPSIAPVFRSTPSVVSSVLAEIPPTSSSKLLIPPAPSSAPLSLLTSITTPIAPPSSLPPHSACSIMLPSSAISAPSFSPASFNYLTSSSIASPIAPRLSADTRKTSPTKFTPPSASAILQQPSASLVTSSAIPSSVPARAPAMCSLRITRYPQYQSAPITSTTDEQATILPSAEKTEPLSTSSGSVAMALPTLQAMSANPTSQLQASPPTPVSQFNSPPPLTLTTPAPTILSDATNDLPRDSCISPKSFSLKSPKLSPTKADRPMLREQNESASQYASPLLLAMATTKDGSNDVPVPPLTQASVSSDEGKPVSKCLPMDQLESVPPLVVVPSPRSLSLPVPIASSPRSVAPSSPPQRNSPVPTPPGSSIPLSFPSAPSSSTTSNPPVAPKHVSVPSLAQTPATVGAQPGESTPSFAPVASMTLACDAGTASLVVEHQSNTATAAQQTISSVALPEPSSDSNIVLSNRESKPDNDCAPCSNVSPAIVSMCRSPPSVGTPDPLRLHLSSAPNLNCAKAFHCSEDGNTEFLTQQLVVPKTVEAPRPQKMSRSQEGNVHSIASPDSQTIHAPLPPAPVEETSQECMTKSRLPSGVEVMDGNTGCTVAPSSSTSTTQRDKNHSNSTLKPSATITASRVILEDVTNSSTSMASGASDVETARPCVPPKSLVKAKRKEMLSSKQNIKSNSTIKGALHQKDGSQVPSLATPPQQAVRVDCVDAPTASVSSRDVEPAVSTCVSGSLLDDSVDVFHSLWRRESHLPHRKRLGPSRHARQDAL